jgi:hypothetical protein
MATIEVTKDVEELLAVARRENPAQSDAEILKHALFMLHRQRELDRRRAWADSLPTLNISAEEARSITESRKELHEAIRRGEAVPMTVEELMMDALRDE